MRTQTVIKNSIYSMGSYVILFILGLINRKAFLNFLNVEFLGYEGLFSNIFSVLSLAEMGVGSVITYNLYQEIASQNKEEIAKLMMIYKNVYRIIGTMVICVGIILIPFLKFIITENVTNWSYIYYIYIINLIITISTYFLSYRRTLFVANQMEFVCVKIDTIASIISQIAKILILIFTSNYILYLVISLFQNVLTNFIISRKYDKEFAYARKAKISKKDLDKIHFLKDIGNFVVHKMSSLIFAGVDNLVISVILGISTVGMFSNYMLIKDQVWRIITIILRPMQSTIGDLIYNDESKEKGKKLFYMFDQLSFFLASFMSITFFILFQSFIEIWIGKKYLLASYFVFWMALNIYLGAIHEILYYFRSCFGDYEIDRNYMILSSVVNLGLSILLAKRFGVSGIMFSTDLGLLFIWYGRIKVVFKKYLKTSYRNYIIKQIVWILLVLIEGFFTYIISSYFSTSVVGLVVKLIICLIVPNVINLLIFYRTQNFKLIKQYIIQVINIIKVGNYNSLNANNKTK